MKMSLNLIRPLGLAAVLACAGAGLHAQGGAAPGGSAIPGTTSAASGATGSAAFKGSDRSFVNKAAVDGMYEVEAARLAERKASDPAVKALAATLVKDHTEANNELMQLASSKGVTLPSALPRARQKELDKLSQLSGAAFDREFMRRIGIAAHQSDIKLFQNASHSAKDPELKDWVNKTLPTLRDHLAQAEKLPMPAAGSGASSRGAGASGSTGGLSGSAGAGSPGGATGAGSPGGATGTGSPGGATGTGAGGTSGR